MSVESSIACSSPVISWFSSSARDSSVASPPSASFTAMSGFGSPTKFPSAAAALLIWSVFQVMRISSSVSSTLSSSVSTLPGFEMGLLGRTLLINVRSISGQFLTGRKSHGNS